jgi:uncharacterized protein
MKITGRQPEIQLMQDLFEKDESSFLAVYGRRRVGKTFLIREVYKDNIVFECSGLHQKSRGQQLENFWVNLSEANKSNLPVPPPTTWIQAFFQLRNYLSSLVENDTKKVVFLDEIAWFDTPRSGFLAGLDSFWNQYCTKRTDIILVICGSAASWIISKVVNDRGGLHNRLTHRIQLKPFTLRETKTYLEALRVNLPMRDLAQLYMCIGGIPFYLKDLKAGSSFPQLLDQLFFNQPPLLENEFQHLYASLFKNSQLHEKIVATLSNTHKGLSRNDIVAATKIKSSSDLTTALEELVQCGFIKIIKPFDKRKEGHLYRLIDEYTLFYFRFLADDSQNSWSLITQFPSFKIWAGYAFENLCFKHTAEIKKALGISGVITNEYSFNFKGNESLKGTQIDLVIDRADNVINLLEAKFYDDEFVVTEAYARQLRTKVHVFSTHTKTRKAVFITMLSVFGVQKNMHYLGIVTNQLLLEDLFASKY